MSVFRTIAAAAAAILVLLAAPAAALASGAPEGALDSRAWELVSPADKNGGEVAPLGSGLLQAAAQGDAVAFASEASFGEAAGAPPLSEYVARRGVGGWSTANVTPPLLSGTYSAASGDADPYLAFSADLGRALLSSGWACRGASPCAEENTPLGLGGLPAGYRDIYLRQGGAYQPLLTTSNYTPPVPAAEFQLAFEGAGPDLDPVYLRAAGQLYEWSAGTLTPIASVPPPAVEPSPPGGIATIGPVASAADGSRIFFTSSRALLPTRDSNGQPDAYEWEAVGTGSCTESTPGYVAADHGCLGLLSSGRSGSASFAAASASGADAYFLTSSSLLGADADGLLDLYDAREAGGFPEPAAALECAGDDCQGPPFVPTEPAPATSVVSGPPNPAVKFAKKRGRKHHRKRRHRKRRHAHKRHHRGARR